MNTSLSLFIIFIFIIYFVSDCCQWIYLEMKKQSNEKIEIISFFCNAKNKENLFNEEEKRQQKKIKQTNKHMYTAKYSMWNYFAENDVKLHTPKIGYAIIWIQRI